MNYARLTHILTIKMSWYANIIVLVLLIIQNDAKITINGTCPDFGSKLPCNWIAMEGTWYEVQRSAKTSPFQLGTTCVSLKAENIGRYIKLDHACKNVLKQMKTYSNIFEMTSEPEMEVTFMPGITKNLILMGTDYLTTAVFYYCEPQNKSQLKPTSNLFFWVYCRNKNMTQTCKTQTALIFKVRKAEEYLSNLENTDQTCD